MNKELTDALRAPFSKSQIGKLPKVWCKKCTNPKVECNEHKPVQCRVCKAKISPAHLHVDFVGHAHVTERLLNVDSEWNWEPMGFDANGLPRMDEHGGLWIRLTVAGVTRVGYGDADGRRGGDATKAAISDAIKVAAMRFGVGLDLWKKEPVTPVAAEPAQAVAAPTQTDEERKSELRGQIAAIGRQRGKSDADTAGEFFLWTEGRKEISQASLAELAEYKVHIQRSA